MTKFTLSVDMDNAAFEDYPVTELTRILDKVVTQFGMQDFHEGHTKSIMDSNGNKVGSFKFHN